MASRPPFPSDPRRFGRRPAFAIAAAATLPAASMADDLRLFALTFAGGLLFTAVYLV